MTPLNGLCPPTEHEPLIEVQELQQAFNVKVCDSALDTQEGGNHYKDMAIQPIEYITQNKIPYIEANIIKYISRHRDKNGSEDIKKIIHYCEMLLEFEYKGKL